MPPAGRSPPDPRAAPRTQTGRDGPRADRARRGWRRQSPEGERLQDPLRDQVRIAPARGARERVPGRATPKFEYRAVSPSPERGRVAARLEAAYVEASIRIRGLQDGSRDQSRGSRGIPGMGDEIDEVLTSRPRAWRARRGRTRPRDRRGATSPRPSSASCREVLVGPDLEPRAGSSRRSVPDVPRAPWCAFGLDQDRDRAADAAPRPGGRPARAADRPIDLLGAGLGNERVPRPMITGTAEAASSTRFRTRLPPADRRRGRRRSCRRAGAGPKQRRPGAQDGHGRGLCQVARADRPPSYIGAGGSRRRLVEVRPHPRDRAGAERPDPRDRVEVEDVRFEAPRRAGRDPHAPSRSATMLRQAAGDAALRLIT